MFGQTPGKSWYLPTSVHSEALNRLMYVVEQGEAFVLIQGPHGAGKTAVLEQVQAECARAGHSAILMNLAGLDQAAFLWNLCSALYIIPESGQPQSRMLAAIRDEIVGRSLCRQRTVLLLDDVSRANGDVASLVEFLIAINQQTSGAISVLAASDESVTSPLQRRSALKVILTGLVDHDAHEFVRERLKHFQADQSDITESALEYMVQSADGNPSQLSRLCELISVACKANPGLKIDADVMEMLSAETLFSRAG